MYRSLWVPGSRAEPFFPLCPRRSSWIRCPRAGAGLPPARVAAYAPSDIIRTRSRRCASFWRACCCGNCLTALFADRLRAERRRRNRFHQCRFAVGERGSVCHASGAQLDLTEFLHGQTAPNTCLCWRHRQPTVALPSKLIAQRMEPACLPAQHMRTKQSGLAIIDCRYRLPASRRRAEKFINLAHGLFTGRLGVITHQDKVLPAKQDKLYIL